MNFLSSQLFENGRIISWVNLKDEYEWNEWHVLSAGAAKTCSSNKMENTIFQLQWCWREIFVSTHVIKGARILFNDKLSSK